MSKIKSADNKLISRRFDAVWSLRALEWRIGFTHWIYASKIRKCDVTLNNVWIVEINIFHSNLVYAMKTSRWPKLPGIQITRNTIATYTWMLIDSTCSSNQWSGTLSMYSGTRSSKKVRSVSFVVSYNIFTELKSNCKF